MRRTTAAYERISELPIWIGVLGGPIFWGLHLGVGYILVTLPCISNIEPSRGVLYGFSVVVGLAAAACLVNAIVAWRSSGLQLQDDWGEGGGRKGFMAVLGIMFSGISVLAIVMQSFALPFASYCG